MNEHFIQILVPVVGLVSGLIAAYVSLENRALLAEVRRELAEMEGRMFERINGKYIRRAEFSMREEMVDEKFKMLMKQLDK